MKPACGVATLIERYFTDRPCASALPSMRIRSDRI
jgi:hypothetical protein